MGFFVGRPRPRQAVASDFHTVVTVRPEEIYEAFTPPLDDALARKAEPDEQVRAGLVREYLGKGTLNLVNESARTRGSARNASSPQDEGPIYWWRLLVAMTILGSALFFAYMLESKNADPQTRGVLFNIVQVGFPGLLALMGIETTKNG